MSDTSKPFTRRFVLNLPGPDMEVTATKAQEVFEALPITPARKFRILSTY